MLAILVCADGTPDLPRDRRPVILISGREHVRVAKAMLAAAGHRACDVVNSLPADAELLVLSPESPSKKPTRPLVPCVARYDAAVLDALLPGARVLVGSVREHAPSQTWLVDSGSEMVQLAPLSIESFSDTPPVTLAVDLDAMRAVPVGLRSGVGQKIVLRSDALQGVRLRDGDRIVSRAMKGYNYTFLDADGAPALVHTDALQAWRYRSGSLYSHVRFRIAAREVRTREPLVLVPRRPGGPSVPFVAGDRVHLVLVWDDNSEQEFDSLASVDRDGAWSLALRTRVPLLLDPLGICYGQPGVSARECVARGGVYDRPCTHDTECPYFDPRRGEGRCLDGKCAMPLGVGNASFRSADPATPPLLDGCSPDDATYPYCAGLPPTRAIFSSTGA